MHWTRKAKIIQTTNTKADSGKELTKKEPKEALDALGAEYPSKANKTELITLLNEATAGA